MFPPSSFHRHSGYAPASHVPPTTAAAHARGLAADSGMARASPAPFSHGGVNPSDISMYGSQVTYQPGQSHIDFFVPNGLLLPPPPPPLRPAPTTQGEIIAPDWRQHVQTQAPATPGPTHTAAGAFHLGPSSQVVGFAPTHKDSAQAATSRAQNNAHGAPASASRARQTEPGPVARTAERGEAVASLTRRAIERELAPRVHAILDAESATRSGEIAAEVSRQLADGSAARNAAQAEIWSPPPGNAEPSRADFPAASADGFVYLRIREDRLANWISVSSDLRREFDAQARRVEAWQLLADRRIGQLEARVLNTPSRGGKAARTPLASRDNNTAGKKSQSINVDITEARKYVRTLIARLYGLETDFRADKKPQDVEYPDQDEAWPCHPAGYVAHAVDVALAQRSTAGPARRSGAAARFRQLRFNWDEDMREGVNQPWTDAILQYVSDNRGRFGLPDYVTPDILWASGLNTTFEYYRTEALGSREPGHVAKKQRHNHESKMRERQGRKIRRRQAALDLYLRDLGIDGLTDAKQVLTHGLTSPEGTEEELAEEAESRALVVGSGATQKKKDTDAPKKRHALAWRSGAVTAFLHLLDKINPPPSVVIDSGRTVAWPDNKIMAGSIPRCALEESWAEEHLHLVPTLVANVGPFHPAPGSLALSRMSFGKAETALVPPEAQRHGQLDSQPSQWSNSSVVDPKLGTDTRLCTPARSSMPSMTPGRITGSPLVGSGTRTPVAQAATSGLFGPVVLGPSRPVMLPLDSFQLSPWAAAGEAAEGRVQPSLQEGGQEGSGQEASSQRQETGATLV